MPHRIGPRALLYPTCLWLLILLILFGTEYAVMLGLPLIIGSEPPALLAAVVDALTITAVLAPVIWWTLVRPLRQAIRLRTKFLADLFMAIEAERRQTAHELHDGVGQQLSLLISGLRTMHEATSNPNETERYRGLENLAQSALSEVKRLARGLRPSLLDDFGLVAAIEKVVHDCSKHVSTAIELQASSLEGVRLPEPAETALFRILQEGLANVIRHSAAAHATIDLTYEPGLVTLTIQDDGRGFDTQKVGTPERNEGHLGLTGIRERTALLGGRFTLDTAPGKGCRLSVAIPIAKDRS